MGLYQRNSHTQLLLLLLLRVCVIRDLLSPQRRFHGDRQRHPSGSVQDTLLLRSTAMHSQQHVEFGDVSVE